MSRFSFNMFRSKAAQSAAGKSNFASELGRRVANWKLNFIDGTITAGREFVGKKLLQRRVEKVKKLAEKDATTVASKLKEQCINHKVPKDVIDKVEALANQGKIEDAIELMIKNKVGGSTILSILKTTSIGLVAYEAFAEFADLLISLFTDDDDKSFAMANLVFIGSLEGIPANKIIPSKELGITSEDVVTLSQMEKYSEQITKTAQFWEAMHPDIRAVYGYIFSKVYSGVPLSKDEKEVFDNIKQARDSIGDNEIINRVREENYEYLSTFGYDFNYALTSFTNWFRDKKQFVTPSVIKNVSKSMQKEIEKSSKLEGQAKLDQKKVLTTFAATTINQKEADSGKGSSDTEDLVIQAMDELKMNQPNASTTNNLKKQTSKQQDSKQQETKSQADSAPSEEPEISLTYAEGMELKDKIKVFAGLMQVNPKNVPEILKYMKELNAYNCKHLEQVLK